MQSTRTETRAVGCGRLSQGQTMRAEGRHVPHMSQFTVELILTAVHCYTNWPSASQAGGERECHEGSRWRPSPGSLAQPTTLLPRTGSTADRHLLCPVLCGGKILGADPRSRESRTRQSRTDIPLVLSRLHVGPIALLLSPGFPVRERARFSATLLATGGLAKGRQPSPAWSSQISGMERTRFPGGLLVCSRPRTIAVPFERAFCRSPNGSHDIAGAQPHCDEFSGGPSIVTEIWPLKV